MKKIFFVLQLFVLAGIVAFVIYSAVKPVPKLNYTPEAWSSWNGFYAISYAGVTKKGDGAHVSRQQFEDHLRALGQAGYQTIKPEDVVAFLEGRSPLPEKALVLIIEGDRKDSFLYATPILRKFGITATLCVPTANIPAWDSFYLQEDDLIKIFSEAHWNPCSMGNSAVKEIPINSSGGKGHFLTTRQWTDNKSEDDTTFKKRVTADYDRAAQVLSKVSNRPVSLYLYPFADPGTGAQADPLAAEINRKAVEAHHRAAFITANNPFNGATVRPYALNRLRIPGNWDTSKLIHTLNSSMPSRTAVSGMGDKSRWTTQGDILQRGNSVSLVSGTSMWLRGSDAWSDADIRISMVIPEKSVVSLYVRSEGNDSFERLSIHNQAVNLQERKGTEAQTLFRSAIKYNEKDPQNFRLRVKRNRAWIWYNDKLLAGQIPLSSYIAQGRIGISCQQGEVQILDFHAEQLPKVFAFTESYRTISPPLQQDISAVLPPWFLSYAPPTVDKKQRMDLLIAASSGVQTIPIVQTAQEMTPLEIQGFVQKIVALLRDPVLHPLISYLAVYGSSHSLAEELHKEGYSLVLIVSAEQAMQLIKQKKDLYKDILLIDKQVGDAKNAMKNILHTLPPDRIIIRADQQEAGVAGIGTAVSVQKK
ncbi:MAG: hypothetical protein RDU01_08605 [Thermodesulfovibrionales bacterium]|nr:hypothetical protein [Thermodesulfovibrionales bacterium]